MNAEKVMQWQCSSCDEYYDTKEEAQECCPEDGYEEDDEEDDDFDLEEDEEEDTEDGDEIPIYLPVNHRTRNIIIGSVATLIVLLCGSNRLGYVILGVSSMVAVLMLVCIIWLIITTRIRIRREDNGS